MKLKMTFLLGGIGLLLIILALILFSRIKTISTIKKVEGDLYRVEYTADYKLDELLTSDIDSVNELEKQLSKKLFFGYPIKTKEDLFGCSAFSAVTPGGKHLVGRNFDYAKGGAILVHTKPKKGFASYSMVSLAHLGVAKEQNTMPETLQGKLAILAAPYGSVDGMNEKGLSVSVLELQTEPTKQNNGKTPIITTLAVRMLLDKAASTEEAVTLLKKYDMNSSAGKPYHFFISDKSGKSVIVDWAKQKMTVLPTQLATNFQLSQGEDYHVGIGHDRYDTLEKTLKQNNDRLTAADAMKLLEKVKITWNGEWQTEWSVVYHLDNFSVDLVTDMNYKKIHHFSGQSK